MNLEVTENSPNSPYPTDPNGELLHSPYGPRVRDQDDLSKRAFFYFKSKTEIWTAKDRNWGARQHQQPAQQPQPRVTFNLTESERPDDDDDNDQLRQTDGLNTKRTAISAAEAKTEEQSNSEQKDVSGSSSSPMTD